MISYLKSRRSFVAPVFIWIVLWTVPWGKIPTVQENLYFAFLTDMIRLGVAIGLFLIPGILLYIVLKNENVPLYQSGGVVSIGFTFSVALSSLLGLMCRIAGLSFSFVRGGFALVGFIGLIFLMILKPNCLPGRGQLAESFRALTRNPPLVLALFLAVLMTFNDSMFFIDDTTYLAYLINWQRATHLGFNNIIHHANIIEIERFWLAMYPMGQALLSDLSGVPGILLLSNYLEIYLVVIAVLASYWLSRRMGLTRRAAGFSVLFQVTLYTWMIGDQWPAGFWFFVNMAEDKVTAAFILSPVFFIFALWFIQHPSKRNMAMCFIGGVALMLTHPVILFFACIIVGGLAVFSLVANKAGWRVMLSLAVMSLLLMMPYLVIRLVKDSSRFSLDAKSVAVSYQIDRYTNVISDIFYGLNPGVLKFFDILPESRIHGAYQFFRLFPFVLALAAGFMALMKLKAGPYYWYVLTCVLLVVFATIPYTGWILGYFTDARLISRVSWFSPIGLAGVMMLRPVVKWFESSLISRELEKNYNPALQKGTFVGLVICLVFASPILASYFFPRVAYYFDVLNHNKQLVQVGIYIDQATNEPTTGIALDYGDILLLPGVSANTSLISFREEKDDNGHNFFLSTDEIHERIYASNLIRSLDQAVPLKDRCELIEKYKVKYVLSQKGKAEIYKEIIDKCGWPVEYAFQTKELTLLGIK